MLFNKKGFELFKEDVNKALAEVSEKHGVVIECGSITYSDIDFTMKLSVTKNDGTDGKRTLFERECRYYGFKPDDYEREFTYAGKKYKLVGFRPKARKNSCSIVNLQDGKTYVCSPEIIKMSIA